MRIIDINFDNDQQLENIGDAFASKIRRKILRLLIISSYSIQEIASLCSISISTASFHIQILKEAGLIKVIRPPSGKGNEKNISLEAEQVIIRSSLNKVDTSTSLFQRNIRIGSYSHFEIEAPCALCTRDDRVLPFDTPNIFASPEHINAELLSFFNGFVEYTLLSNEFNKKKLRALTISLELCSECPNYNNDWKSDITFWINNVEIGTYRSLGDYGGRKGTFTPSWWGINSTQFGNLLKININDKGTFFNNSLTSSITINDLLIANNDTITLRIGVKKSSKYVGGINIFGKHFGDYNQDITFMVEYC